MTLVGLNPERVGDAADVLRAQADAAEESAMRVRAALALADMVSDVPQRLQDRAETWRDAAAELEGRAETAEAFRLAGLEAAHPVPVPLGPAPPPGPAPVGPPFPGPGPLGSGSGGSEGSSSWSGGGGSLADSPQGPAWGSVLLATGTASLQGASSLPGLSVSSAPYSLPGGLIVVQPPHGGLVMSGNPAYPTYRPRLPGPTQQIGFRAGPTSLTVARRVSTVSRAAVLPGVAFDAVESYRLYDNGERSDVNVTVQMVGRTAASTGGAFAGAKAGCALVGVPFAGAGPVSGAGACLVGAVAGGLIGSTAGKWAWDHSIGPGVDAADDWWSQGWRDLGRPRLPG